MDELAGVSRDVLDEDVLIEDVQDLLKELGPVMIHYDGVAEWTVHADGAYQLAADGRVFQEVSEPLGAGRSLREAVRDALAST